jgi:imidazolonepropionase-like amidohydrolase
MRELLQKESSLSPREVVEMATVNAAKAIGQRDLLGRIQAGLFADLIAIPHLGSAADVFENVVAFEHNVPWMMVNGKAIGLS